MANVDAASIGPLSENGLYVPASEVSYILPAINTAAVDFEELVDDDAPPAQTTGQLWPRGTG